MVNKNYWQDRNVLITGCTGFLGGHLTKLLVNQDTNVVGLVRDRVPRADLFREGLYNKITVVNGCIEDYQLLERTINEYEIETIFHLGAQTIVRIANRNPISTFKSNIEGTWNVLEASRRNSTVKSIVIASSDKAYGTAKKIPYNETACLKGEHPYDVSKSCADLLAKSYFKTYNLPVCITRCGNFYGPGDLNFNRIVPGTIRSVIRNKNPIIRSDGSFIRDYFYIKNGASAYVHLAEKMEDTKIHGEAFNFSNEQPLSVIEITQLILQVMGREDLKPEIRNEASNEIPEQWLSSEKAKKMLDWKAKFSIKEGLAETVEWYKELLK
ncbi:MAG: GDP-mannose 4,6-dehydratase [Candidatus Heimdallarchaeota archaeon]